MISKNIELLLYEKSMFIREFEKILLKLFEKGFLSGTTHTSIGQELIAVSLLNNLKKNDFVISNHRSHAHFIAYCNEIKLLFRELLGKENGICKGKAGSQHIHYKNFLSNGILGNMLPVAAGLALSLKKKKKENIVHVFLGDGAFGQGVLYETLYFCYLNKLKCLFIVENNKIAQTTPIENNFAGSFKERFSAFNIQFEEINNINNIKKFILKINNIKQYVLKKNCPYGIVINTQRLAAHSKGDDSRSENFLNKLKKEDSLLILEKKIKKKNILKIKDKIKWFYKKLLIANNIQNELY